MGKMNERNGDECGRGECVGRVEQVGLPAPAATLSPAVRRKRRHKEAERAWTKRQTGKDGSPNSVARHSSIHRLLPSASSPLHPLLSEVCMPSALFSSRFSFRLCRRKRRKTGMLSEPEEKTEKTPVLELPPTPSYALNPISPNLLNPISPNLLTASDKQLKPPSLPSPRPSPRPRRKVQLTFTSRPLQ